MSYRLKARAPLGAFGVSPMPSMSGSKRFVARPGRSGQGAVLALAACALLLVVGFAGWQARRQAAVAADTAAALAQLRGQQSEIQGLARQLADLRGAHEQLRAELDRRLSGPATPMQAAQPAPNAVASLPVADAARPARTATAAQPPGPPPRANETLSAAMAASTLPVPPMPDVMADQPVRRVAAHHPARLRHRPRTVTVNGVTYVRGREPHELGLPVE